MWWVQALQKRGEDGAPSDIFHLVAQSDEGGGTVPGCDHDHRSVAEAEACEDTQNRCDRVTGIARLAQKHEPSVAELARLAFEAYSASTGGKTWDGKDIPPFEVVRERTPHVARAWEAAVDAVRKAVKP